MKKIWFLLCSMRDAKIFEAQGPSGTFTKVMQINNPTGGLLEQELVSDRPGRAAHFRGMQRSPMRGKRDTRDHVLNEFLTEVADKLALAQSEHKFDELILVAEPHTLGRLRTAISSNRTLVVGGEIPHDLLNTPEPILRTEIQRHMSQRG
jgi:protein required for attachment to host cells